MASQPELGLRTERWSGVGRSNHHHPAVDESHLTDLRPGFSRNSQRNRNALGALSERLWTAICTCEGDFGNDANLRSDRHGGVRGRHGM